jgi:peptidoglycan/LPS O-acetylase OafA/YrhL
MVADQRKKEMSGWFILLIVIGAIVASDVAKQHMQNSAAIGVGGCTIVLLAVAKIRWDLKGKWWFWLALCVGAALQMPLIFLMPSWSDHYLTGAGAMAFVIPGFLMALGTVFLAEKVFASSSNAPDDADRKANSERYV